MVARLAGASQVRLVLPGYATIEIDLKHEKAAGDRESVQAAERSYVERTAPKKKELTDEQLAARTASRKAKKIRATVYHSLYATVAYPCIGSRVRIPQFDSAQKTQTGVVTGSKPTLAFTCYPPVPKPDASPHDPGMQFCDGVSFTLCHRCISGYATVA